MQFYLLIASIVCILSLHLVDFTEGKPNRSLKPVPCLDDSYCGRKETCNRYKRECERCKLRGYTCRRHGHCCGGLHCIFGHCMDPLRTDGNKLSSCKNHKDCNEGFCCAKEEGILVCKPYKQEDDSCTLPYGGINHFVRHDCPCELGLKCGRSSLSQDENDLRCIKHEPFPFSRKWKQYKHWNHILFINHGCKIIGVKQSSRLEVKYLQSSVPKYIIVHILWFCYVSTISWLLVYKMKISLKRRVLIQHRASRENCF